ncbi:Type I restriction-modification system, specificity subunit S [Streptococcus oralis]|uniref:Type I restriction-modification system, specificity subunit S n=1 Tax=Streptococcus oralis TaxID=1303 RepID=A0A139Q6W9_STROR|nr:restriction endonuclease subunit S [Streptococcus oralis]KXT98299.1 Type I restriction-modification system, specificity subunit S [Streptococcus oralis]
MTRMKESGIDWIGQIPEEWEVIKFKYLGDVKQGLTYSPSDIVDKDEGILVLRSGNIQNGVLDFTNNVYVKTKVAESIVLRKNDILITARNGSSALIGKNAIIDTDIKATFGAFMMVFRTNKSLIAKFAFYLMNISFNFYRTFFATSTVNQLTAAIFNGIEVPLPSIAEQQKIADFLDKKTAQLDKIKALLGEQIQKLKDYRASLIYETVTKGLDKTVPMKDSGIDWIGQVPGGWGVKRLKDYVDFQTGTTPPQSIGVNQERKGVRWFKPGDFSDESVDLTSAENYITSEVVIQQKLSVYPEKTILVVGIASIGKVGYSENHSYSNQQITALKVTGQIFPKYLAYLMFSSGQYIRETALYTIVPIINNQYLSSLKIVLPNRVVQETIVEYLDKKIGQINKMIVIKNEQIKNINKQRQTLIYDYVTGKRRV